MRIWSYVVERKTRGAAAFAEKALTSETPSVSSTSGRSERPHFTSPPFERASSRAFSPDGQTRSIAPFSLRTSRALFRSRGSRGTLPLRQRTVVSVSYTHLRAHETDSYLVCRL